MVSNSVLTGLLVAGSQIIFNKPTARAALPALVGAIIAAIGRESMPARVKKIILSTCLICLALVSKKSGNNRSAIVSVAIVVGSLALRYLSQNKLRETVKQVWPQSHFQPETEGPLLVQGQTQNSARIPSPVLISISESHLIQTLSPPSMEIGRERPALFANPFAPPHRIQVPSPAPESIITSIPSLIPVATAVSADADFLECSSTACSIDFSEFFRGVLVAGAELAKDADMIPFDRIVGNIFLGGMAGIKKICPFYTKDVDFKALNTWQDFEDSPHEIQEEMLALPSLILTLNGRKIENNPAAERQMLFNLTDGAHGWTEFLLVKEKVFAEIDKFYQRGETIFVHCSQGWNRSAAVLLAYLIERSESDISIAQIWSYMKSKRAMIAQMNWEAIGAVVKYYAEEKGRIIGLSEENLKDTRIYSPVEDQDVSFKALVLKEVAEDRSETSSPNLDDGEAMAGAGSGEVSAGPDSLAGIDPAEQLEFEYKARAKNIERLFAKADTGIVVRMLGGKRGGAATWSGATETGQKLDEPEVYIPYEFNEAFSRSKYALSSTLLIKGTPVSLASAGYFGLIYNPNRLYVNQAFHIDGMTNYGRRRGNWQIINGEKVRIEGIRNYAAHGNTHHELAEDLPRIHEERQRRGRVGPMPHNELTIWPYEEKEKKEIIIGIVVRPEFAENLAELKRIYDLVSVEKPNLPIFSYDSIEGQLTLLEKP